MAYLILIKYCSIDRFHTMLKPYTKKINFSSSNQIHLPNDSLDTSKLSSAVLTISPKAGNSEFNSISSDSVTQSKDTLSWFLLMSWSIPLISPFLSIIGPMRMFLTELKFWKLSTSAAKRLSFQPNRVDIIYFLYIACPVSPIFVGNLTILSSFISIAVRSQSSELIEYRFLLCGSINSIPTEWNPNKGGNKEFIELQRSEWLRSERRVLKMSRIWQERSFVSFVCRYNLSLSTVRAIVVAIILSRIPS